KIAEEKQVSAFVNPMRSWRSPMKIVPRTFDAYGLLGRATKFGARLIHAHDQWRAPYARFLSRKLGIPYVVHMRGPMSERDIRKFRLGDADAVIAIARRYAGDLVSAGVSRDRIHLIDDSVDLTLFDSTKRDNTHSSPDGGGKIVIGLVGR